jgi:hypothetical protein
MDSNIPIVNLTAALDPSQLGPWIEYQLAGHEARTNELMAAYDRFLVATAAGIDNDELAGRAADFVKQLKSESSATDVTRTTTKAPVLHAQRLIDGAAKKITDKLSGAAGGVQERITAYLRVKEIAARKVAEEEAARTAAEAEARLEAAR